VHLARKTSRAALRSGVTERLEVPRGGPKKAMGEEEELIMIDGTVRVAVTTQGEHRRIQ
jgi:hypothetical protein